MDRRKSRTREYPYGNNAREESESNISGFHKSSVKEDDDDDDEIMFLKEVYNNPTDGYAQNSADMNILRSVLIEEDDSESNGANLIQAIDGNNVGTFDTAEQHNAKVTYLHNYKRMIQQQELEQMATIEHLLPLFEGIRKLGNNGTNNTHVQTYLKSYAQNHSNYTQQGSVRDLPILTYDQMKRALRTLEGSSSNTCTSVSQGIIQTDEQLLMTLRELVSISKRNHDDQRTMLLGLTFPEFLQCYRVVVNGMQILEMISNSTVDATGSQPQIPYNKMDSSKNVTTSQGQSKQKWIPKLRSTTTSRVLAMIRTFTIPAEEVSHHSTTTYSNTIDTIIAAAELRNILTAKDQQLAHMITIHEEEIDELAHQINQVTMQHRRRSYSISAFWILCIIATSLYSSRKDRKPLVTSVTALSNISTSTIDNNHIPMQQQNDRPDVESIVKDLSDGVSITKVQLEVLQESYENATQLLKQINALCPRSAMCHPYGSLDGPLCDAIYMDWCQQRQQIDTSILEAISTPPVNRSGGIDKKFTLTTNQSNGSKEDYELEERQNPPLTLVPFRILKSNLPYIAATSVMGVIVTGIAIYQPGMTLFFQSIFRIFFRF